MCRRRPGDAGPVAGRSARPVRRAEAALRRRAGGRRGATLGADRATASRTMSAHDLVCCGQSSCSAAYEVMHAHRFVVRSTAAMAWPRYRLSLLVRCWGPHRSSFNAAEEKISSQKTFSQLNMEHNTTRAMKSSIANSERFGENNTASLFKSYYCAFYFPHWISTTLMRRDTIWHFMLKSI